MSVKPEELSRTRANLSQIKRLTEEYDQVIANFGPKQKPTQSGAPSRAELEAEARRRGLLK